MIVYCRLLMESCIYMSMYLCVHAFHLTVPTVQYRLNSEQYSYQIASKKLFKQLT